MTRIFLDTGVLGLVTHPNNTDEAVACKRWFQNLLDNAVPVHLPEIVDYELRRKLLQLNSARALRRLDELRTMIRFEPITTPAMLKAAELWAEARQQRHPTASDEALDADVILAAQATTSTHDSEDVVVVTTNVGHLSRFVKAVLWTDPPEMTSPTTGSPIEG